VRIKALQLLEKIFEGLAHAFEDLRTRVAVCPDCGQNRYTGKPCVNAGTVPTNSPCGLPMTQFDTNTFARHIRDCRVCGDVLQE
jgi:hypothetical protein